MSVHDFAGQGAPAPADQARTTLSWGRYGAVLLRRWLTLLVCTVAGLGLGFGYLETRPQTATAVAMVNLNLISQKAFDAPREPSGLIDAQTEVQTARSSRVLANAAARLGGISADELRTALTAEVLPDATVLQISYTDTTVERATAGADEIARQFLAYRSALAVDRVSRVVDRLTERRERLRVALLEAQRMLATAPPRSQRAARAAQERAILREEVKDLIARLGELDSIDTTGGTVLTSAEDIDVKLSPRVEVVLGAGALLGLLLGCVVAFARDALDRRVRGPHDTEAAGAGVTLARLARSLELPPSQRRSDELRCLWELARGDEAGQPMIVGLLEVDGRAAPDDSFAVLAGGLATSLADHRSRAQLMLVGFSRAQVHRLAGPLGLRVVRTSPETLSFADQSGRVEALWLDPRADQAATLDHIDRELRTRRRSGTHTVVALGAGASSAARMVVARRADVTVITVHRKHTLKAGLRRAVDDVAAVGGHLLGTVELHGRRRRRVMATGSDVVGDVRSTWDGDLGTDGAPDGAQSAEQESAHDVDTPADELEGARR